MSDILIGTTGSASTASMVQISKRPITAFSPHVGMAGGVASALSNWLGGLLLRLDVREFACRQLFQTYFFPKVISPPNYNRAVVTMAVVWSPQSQPLPKVFNFLLCVAVRNINQSSEFSRRLTLKTSRVYDIEVIPPE